MTRSSELSLLLILHARAPWHHDQCLLGNSSSLGIEPEELPFLNRGWALQERLLSPRTVHFTPRELMWDCLGAQSCECSQTRTRLLGTRKPELQPSLWRDDSVEAFHEQWVNLLQAYSCMALTLPKDIFPALQMFAKAAPPCMGKNLAGLWRKTLLIGLTWSSLVCGTSLRPKEWRAPTWSWASVSGNVVWPYWHEEASYKRIASVTIVGATTKPKGPDPTGELHSGKLTIRGRGVLGRVVHPGPNDREPHLKSDTGPSLSFLCDHKEELFQYCSRSPSSSYATKWDYAIAAQGPDHVPDGAEIIIVKLLDDTSVEMSPLDCQSCWLILRTCIQGDTNTFERIGLCISWPTVKRSSGSDWRKLIAIVLR
jgi:hypothetical protein